MIQEKIHTHVASALSPEIGRDDYEVEIPPAGQPGHFAIACFPFAKALGKPPVQIAQDLGESLMGDADIARVDVVGPFVNVTMSDGWYAHYVSEYQLPEYAKKDETMIVDYIGANIGKPLHVGHFCTPTYGQAIINAYRYLGYDVVSDVHQGDWGIIFGKLIAGWERYGDEQAFTDSPVDHLFELYVKMSNEAKDDEKLEEEFREVFRRLAEGEEKLVAVWKRFTDASLEKLAQVMKRLYVDYDYAVGESFYEGLDLPPATDQPPLQDPEGTMSFIVEELIKKGVATRNEDGSAGIVFPKDTKIPSVMLQKRNGTHGYLASDLGTIKYRKTVWNPSKIVICTDVPQKLHIQQVYWTAKQAGWGLEEAELVHAINGSVKLKDGAMSTRKGKIVRLESVLEEGVKRVENLLEEKGRELSSEDIESICVGAIKYAFLSQDRERDIIFDWEKILAFEGNSGPYVQYTIVRLRKLISQVEGVPDFDASSVVLGQYDIALLQYLLFFEKNFLQSAANYKFHGLVNYCYELSNHVNRFYTNTDKLTEEKDTNLLGFRVSLLGHVLSVLEQSFVILAIPIPKEM